MNSHHEQYSSPQAVASAIKDAANKAHAADPSRQVDDLIRQAHHDRFLCRVFSDGDESDWVLKGGGGMLARVPNARRTLDADLYRSGYDKDRALADLRRLSEVDLEDFFRFPYRDHNTILGGDTQPHADGYRVTFDAFLGTRLLEPIRVDLSVHEGGTSNLTIAVPANRLELPKLVGFPYRLYPLVNQVADKAPPSPSTRAGRRAGRRTESTSSSSR